MLSLQAIREPFDYYKMGCDFAAGMVDNDNSIIEGFEQIAKMQEQVHAQHEKGACMDKGRASRTPSLATP